MNVVSKLMNRKAAVARLSEAVRTAKTPTRVTAEIDLRDEAPEVRQVVEEVGAGSVLATFRRYHQ